MGLKMIKIFDNIKAVFSSKLTLKRTILSYVVGFIIPTIVMTLLVQTSIINSIYEQAKDSICEELNFSKYTIEQQISNFSTIKNYISFDESIEGSDLPFDYLAFKNVQMDLRRISSSNNLIGELSIYMSGSRYLVSTRSSYHIKRFLKMHPIKGIRDEKVFYNFLNEYKKQSLLHAEVKAINEKACMFIYFTNDLKGELKHVLIFTTLESRYHAELKRAIGNNIGCSFITDSNNNIISYYNTDKNRSHESYFSLLTAYEAANTNGIVECNGDLIYSLKSDYAPITYSIIVSEQSFVEQTSYIRYIWYSVIFIVLLFGSFIALFLGHTNYKPINSLRYKASTFYDPSNINIVDDYHYLYDAMEYIELRNIVLQNNLDDINDYIIFKLLKGDFVSDVETSIMAKLVRAPLNNAVFRVFIIKPRNERDKRDLYTEIQTLLPESIRVMIRNREKKNTYVIILIYSEDDVDDNDLLHSLLGEKYLIRHGSLQKKISHVSLSYIEAELDTEGSPLYKETYNQLEDAVICRDMDLAKSLLQMLLKYLKESTISLSDAKLATIRFSLLISHVAKSYKLHMDLSILPDTFMILRYKSMEDAVLFFECYAENLITELLSPNTIHGDLLYEQMVNYIKSHYRDLNFSFQQMADDFNMTLPVLNRQFFSFSGQNLSDFTTEIKIATTKSLLSTTDLSVKDIGMEVGYYNANSFIRWFKKSTGMTPGTFRKQK